MNEPTSPTTTVVRLLGERIPLRTTDNDPEFTSEVIELVSARIEAAESRASGRKLAHQVTLLALLDLAEEYVRAKKRTVEYQAELESRSEELLKLLEAAAPTDQNLASSGSSS